MVETLRRQPAQGSARTTADPRLVEFATLEREQGLAGTCWQLVQSIDHFTCPQPAARADVRASGRLAPSRFQTASATMTPVTPGDPDSDGSAQAEISEAVWAVLCSAVAAAHSGDSDAFRSESLRLDELGPEGIRLAGFYLTYLLWRGIRGRMAQSPTPDQLRDVADALLPNINRVVACDLEMLHEVLAMAFDHNQGPWRRSRAELVLISLAAEGAVAPDPYDELATLRPEVEAWLQSADIATRIPKDTGPDQAKTP
jgi:hypothetical protein